ncbi:MAG: heat-inducible transcriptional repressor HrcA [Cyanobacteria bacterium J06588_5]
MKLTSRQQDVLRATVRHYVNTAEPVGSRSLATGYDLQVSAATIRNVMSVLETSGLLYQPHTSAGRIPSDSGYRTYVDELMVPSEPLTRQMTLALTSGLNLEGQAIEALLQDSAQLLARLSGYIALVTLPQIEAVLIKHLQLVRVSDQQILLVVLDIYNNHSVLLRLPGCGMPAGKAKDSDQIDRELQLLSNFLTAQLKGRSLHEADSDWAELDWAELDQVTQRYADVIEEAISALARKSKAAKPTQILVSGLAEALDQPEFAERDQIRQIVQLLEDGRDQLWPLIVEPDTRPSVTGEVLFSRRRLRISIGAENSVAPMRSCALVTAQYGDAPGPVGSLGVLGPTRMLYENAVAAVEAAANCLTEAVSETFDVGTRLTPER